MSTDSDVIPLPADLSNCGCPFAPTQHATNCATAIAFDAIPLRDRPEYESGKRFAAISWDFPLRITGTISVEVELDPVAIILAHADDYARFDLEPGYEEWEKPMVWLTQQIVEQTEPEGVWFGSRRLSRDTSLTDDVSEYPRWTAEDTARVDAALAAQVLVNPNQGALEV